MNIAEKERRSNRRKRSAEQRERKREQKKLAGAKRKSESLIEAFVQLYICGGLFVERDESTFAFIMVPQCHLVVS